MSKPNPIGWQRTQSHRTKIVCTIGPACRSPKKLLALVAAGMDVARLHFSYADRTEHAENISRLRQAMQVMHRNVSILQDLTGSKARLGDFAHKKVELREGAEFILTAQSVEGTTKRASLNFPELITVVERGDIVLLADGELQLTVQSRTETDLRCKVVVGGRLKSQQAVHVPGKSVPLRVPTAKDQEDVRFGVRQGVDWIAQSYVTSAEEIEDLRDFVRSLDAATPVIAKIERRAALTELDSIINAADAVMVARGDLGLEIPLEKIALVQKDIIRRANAAGKPVITATEMLFSMMTSLRPTRAEVADITNAILDGTDAVMLSGETAMGKHPIAAMTMMASIIRATDDQVSQKAVPFMDAESCRV